MKNLSVILVVLLIICYSSLKAQSGNPDSTFATNGKLYINISPISNSTDFANTVALQTDGKVLIAGSTWTGSTKNFALARCNSDGTLDNTFNQSGIVTTEVGISSVIHSIAIQPNNKIIAVGCSESNQNDGFLLVRYNCDGSLDSSFGINGIVRTQISGVEEGARTAKIQGDGKIIVGGYSGSNESQNFALARYESNGMIDTTFGENGIQITKFNDEPDGITSIALQSDGKIVAGGYSYLEGISNFALARYNSDGSLDNTFGSEGKIISLFNNQGSSASSIAIQKTGKIVLGGSCGEHMNSNFILARYNSDGSIDNSFNNIGYTITDIDSSDHLYAIALWSDDRIIVAGKSYDITNNNFVLAQFDSDGTIDSSFANYGIKTTPIPSGLSTRGGICLQNDGKIITACSEFVDSLSNWDFVIARFLTNLNLGVKDFILENCDPLIYPNPVTSEFQFSYFLTKKAWLSLRLFDMQGNLCQTFYLNQFQEAGQHMDKLYLNSCLPRATYLLELKNVKDKVGLRIIKN